VLIFVLCIQLKVVVVTITDQPRLIFVAAKLLEVGDELLFDYNDKDSSCAFLRQCPVCGTDQPPQPESEPQPQSQKRKKQHKQHKSPKKSRTEQQTPNLDESPLWTQRLKLLHEVEQHFGAGPLTRSVIEQWRPTLTAEEVGYILLQRNMAATNAMIRSMSK